MCDGLSKITREVAYDIHLRGCGEKTHVFHRTKQTFVPMLQLLVFHPILLRFDYVVFVPTRLYFLISSCIALLLLLTGRL